MTCTCEKSSYIEVVYHKLLQELLKKGMIQNAYLGNYCNMLRSIFGTCCRTKADEIEAPCAQCVFVPAYRTDLYALCKPYFCFYRGGNTRKPAVGVSLGCAWHTGCYVYAFASNVYLITILPKASFNSSLFFVRVDKSTE